MFFERKEIPLKDTNRSYPIRHRRRNKSRLGMKYGFIITAIVMAMVAGSIFIFNSPLFRVEVVVAPPPEPTRVPFEQPTSAPISVPDVVVEPSYAVGIEFPALGFYSSDLVLAPGQE